MGMTRGSGEEVSCSEQLLRAALHLSLARPRAPEFASAESAYKREMT